MKTLQELCIPRESIFDKQRRDTVLDLTDLVEDKIDAGAFFEENFATDGMKRLLREAFLRFDGKSEQGAYVLTQAMGGGKTHNMVALGLLAKHPDLRKKVMGDAYTAKNLGAVRVVAFTGRESDAPYGVWGAIADQLGKKDQFKDYYAPLKAPGQTAWVNLLKGEPLLILLDELPPYLENAKSTSIGSSDLGVVTATAISNLLVAIGKEQLSNVAIVVSDLRATYQGGSQQLNAALENLRSEVGRGAMELTPVGLNTDDLYHILRTRLFKKVGEGDEVRAIAEAYAKAVKDAKQMDITAASPQEFAAALMESYPFHFSIKDLYARFRENPGFQQTRGLIRFMRVVVSRLWETKQAGKQSLIHAHDIDLNHDETGAEISWINLTLDNAISHDIADKGRSVAELLDEESSARDAQDACKLLLMASLANTPNARRGLTDSEAVSFLCQPGRDIARLRKDVLGVLLTKAWYLHTDRDGRLLFKDTQNLVAKLNTIASSFNQESRVRELRDFLNGMFKSKLRDCYQEVDPLPPIDEIKVKEDRVTLVIFSPHAGGGLHPDLQKLFDDTDYKNRLLFLSGEREAMSSILATSAELRAINHILEEMNSEHVPDNDPQRRAAQDILDNIQLRLVSGLREAFTKLYYPQGDAIRSADFLMAFSGNKFDGEQQVRETLKAKQKFTEDISSDTFRKKCEKRLFTQQVMPLREIQRRAAMNTEWQWHKPDAIDDLVREMIMKDQWREEGGYLDKGPFPQPKTEVGIVELKRDDNTGEMLLRLTPLHGDRVHFEIGADATEASATVDNAQAFKTAELAVSFLAVDSKKEHETGDPKLWRNRITLKSRFYQQDSDKVCELQSGPPVPIRYTTDGSNPKNSGGAYEGPFTVPKGTTVVQAVAAKGGHTSDVYNLPVQWDKDAELKIDPLKPVTWKRDHDLASTKESYEYLDRLKKFGAKVPGPRITIHGTCWIELVCDDKLDMAGEQLEQALQPLRAFLSDGQVSLIASAIKFQKGQDLLDWVAEVKTELKSEEVVQ